MINAELDVLICTVPKLLPVGPIQGPALLKAVAQQAGYSVKVIDFNLALYAELNDDSHWYEKITFDDREYFAPFYQATLEKIVDSWAKQVVEISPRFFAISVFGYQNYYVTEELCRKIKAINPNQKILIGGNIKEFDEKSSLLAEKVIDHYILGEGEEAFLELLRGNENFPGIYSYHSKSNRGSSPQIRDLNSLPYPDYSDTPLDSYYHELWGGGGSQKFLYITGSRGCVQDCSFCNVRLSFPKFRFKSGTLLAEEMIDNYERYGAEVFQFTDSLINGSLKELRAFCERLVKYKADSGKTFKWRGHFIVKPKQRMPAEYYDLMANAGAATFFVGVESGSEKIRRDMNKFFTNDDLDYMVEQVHRVGITCSLLMIIGYFTELEDDHKMTIDMLAKYGERGYFVGDYGRRTIGNVALGTTLMVHEGTRDYKKMIDLGVKVDKNGDWYLGNNTMLRRLERYGEIKNKLKEIGAFYNQGPYQFLAKVIKKKHDSLLDQNITFDPKGTMFDMQKLPAVKGV